MQQKSKQKLWRVVVQFTDGTTMPVVVRASKESVAASRALKRVQGAVKVKKVTPSQT